MSLSDTLKIVNGINEVGNFLQLFRSAISYLRSRWNNGEQEQQIQEHEARKLREDLQRLSETLYLMYNLLDRAEWRSHEKCVKELLPKLNDAVYDAEDLLDEFRWYEIKISIEGNSLEQLSSLTEFFCSVNKGSFNKVTAIQNRLNDLSSHLERMGLCEVTPRFDKSIRRVTTSFPTYKTKILGRKDEIKEVLRLLGVPNNSSNSSSKRKRTCNAADNEPTAAFVPVLPIVGIGGVGKTTLAQEITKLQRVKSHYDKITWICVSDEFDAEQLTKVLIKSLSGKEAEAHNFDDLQQDLAREVGKKRFLLILDDIWPDVLNEGGRNWRTFCAPLKSVHQESRILVTTRFLDVANLVGTKKYFGLEEYIELRGLEPKDFWDLFKLCVFGSENSYIDPQFEMLGQSILPKLKGSPLAAVTIGRLLQLSLTTEHWNNILNSELWQLPQKETEILPALRLSYMYLPFHLKRCFSFCAVYPKDYKFDKVSLAEIWVAEGFVEPQGYTSLQDIGGQYFDELVNLSFFQKLRGKYVIHDLMHDMAQLVSKDECFILKKASDIEKVPQNVHHLSILTSSDFNSVNLTSLYKHEKLRTLFCKKALYNKSLAQVTNHWITELKCLRAISLASVRWLPENISQAKHLRYLEISSRACRMMRFPLSFCHLYYLQILYAKNCLFVRLPSHFNNLINLQKFEAQVHTYTLDFDDLDWGKKFALFSNSIQNLIIDDIGLISKDYATKLGNIWKMKCLNCLILRWSSLRSQEHIGIEVLQALNPSTNTSLKSLHLYGYPGEYLPWGSHLCNIQISTSPLFGGSNGPEENISQNEQPVMLFGSNIGGTGSIFPSLTELRIEESEILSSLEQFLQPYCVPEIKKIIVEKCPRLSLQSSKVGDLSCLEELMVCDCPNIIFGGISSPYLKKLTLKESINLGVNLTFTLQLEIWSLPALLELTIFGFSSLTFITKANLSHHSGINSCTGTLPLLTYLCISCCKNLKIIDGLLSHECLPAIRKIIISCCDELQSLPGERFGSLSTMKTLEIDNCPRLKWQSGMGLPSSLERLFLEDCGDMSSWFPGCLENLNSLQSLGLVRCEHVVSIPGHMWRRNLASLRGLQISKCPDLESMGGTNAVAHLERVHIDNCTKLKEVDQPYDQINR